MLKLCSEQKRHLAKQVCMCVSVYVGANLALLVPCSCRIQLTHPNRKAYI